jgi:hypothetical protein
MIRKFFIVFILTAFVSCSKQKIIPEDTLSEIVYRMNIADVVLFARESPAIQFKDSIRVYEPIVEKFGYSFDDLRRTFLKYTSEDEKLQSVFMKVAKRIEEEKNLYTEPARIEKLLENMNVGADSVVIVAKIANKQNIEIRLTEQGVYDISASYFFYRNDSTKNPKMAVWLESRTTKDSIMEKHELNLLKDTVFTDYSIRVNFNKPEFNILKIYWLDFDKEQDSLKLKTQITSAGKKTNSKIKRDTTIRQHLIIKRKSVKYNLEESDTAKLKEKDMFTGPPPPPPQSEFAGKDSSANIIDTVRQTIMIRREDSTDYGI